jgi:catechol 2,3-dioxygenase-like lactoylglutathione lyase family enzyme
MITGMPRIAIAVNDFDAIVTTFRDGFGMPVFDMSGSSVDDLGARLAMCVPPGGSKIELMCPAAPDAPLSKSLQRFLDRRGEGLFALMLEAPVPDDEAKALTSNGLNVLPVMQGAAGRDIHPGSTHGVLIRVYPVNSFEKQLPETGKSLNLSGITSVMIAVGDIEQAVEVYGKGLGLPVDPAIVDKSQGVISALCHPPSGGVIQLIAVHDSAKPLAGSLQSHLNLRGEGMYALVLQTEETDSVAAELSSRGLNLKAGADGVMEANVFGARIRIESRIVLGR